MLADREKDAGGALVRKRLQHRGRVDQPWAVVEGQHDFLVLEEVELLEMLETKTRASGGVDLHHAGNTEHVRPAIAGHLGAGRGRWSRRRGRGWLLRRRRAFGGGCCWSWGGSLANGQRREGGARRHKRNRARKDQTC